MPSNNPFEEDIAERMESEDTRQIVEYLKDEAQWVKKEVRYLGTEVGRETPMPGHRAETIEDRLRDMDEMARVVKERRQEGGDDAE